MNNDLSDITDCEEIDWSNYAPFFKKSEFDCSYSGENKMKKDFMDKLYLIRRQYGKPMIITSGYRSEEHPVEARKHSPGWHTMGKACDIACWSDEAFQIIKLALEAGFTGIGVSQSPSRSQRFIHLDTRTGVPRIYSY